MESIWQRWEAGKARREEREALLLFGASLPPSPEVAVIDEKIAAFTRTLAVSLARDRADYAAVAPWARPLVVPLLAAAVASYAGSRFAALIKSRYSPATSSQHPAAGTQRPVKD